MFSHKKGTEASSIADRSTNMGSFECPKKSATAVIGVASPNKSRIDTDVWGKNMRQGNRAHDDKLIFQPCLISQSPPAKPEA